MTDFCHFLTFFQETYQFWTSIDTGWVVKVRSGVGGSKTTKTKKWDDTNGRVLSGYDINM